MFFFLFFFACDFFSVYLGMASVAAAAAAAAAGEMSSPQLTFCADSYWMTPFNPSVTAVAHKRPGHSARCAGSRLQLNTHTPLTQRSLSGLTMLSRQSVRTYQGNELGRNSSGNDCLQSPQLAELPWTDPTTTIICNSRIREKNQFIKMIWKAEIRQEDFPSVGEAGKILFWPSQGVRQREPLTALDSQYWELSLFRPR